MGKHSARNRREKRNVSSIPERLRILGYSSYRSYLMSSHWQDVRRRFYASKLVYRVNGQPCCDACRRMRKLSLHHRTYARLGQERLNDLMLVCDECHKMIHDRPMVDLWRTSKLIVQHKLMGRPLSCRSEKVTRSDPNDTTPAPWD